MKNFIFSIALMAGTAALVPDAAAQSNEDLCNQFDSYELGLYEGSKGETVFQADKRIEKCLKYGVTLNKDDYVRGVKEGNKTYCTAERGRTDLANNQSPKRACKFVDNPYIWEFRGEPLVDMPPPGEASFARAKQDIPLDLDYTKGVYSKVNASKGESAYERVGLSKIKEILDQRIDMMEKQRAGQPLLPVAVNSPGPKYRKGMTSGEVIGGLFKASNWKSGDDLSPMRIRKKNCKAGLWSEYGEQHGQFGADIEEEIAKATKKCAKHKVVFNEAEYRAGFQKSVADYCGYERGFFTSLADNDPNANCTTGQFPNYMKGRKHGDARRAFVDIDKSIFRTKDFYKTVVKFYNSGSFPAGEFLLNEVDLKGLFGPRKNIQRFVANERVRLIELENTVEAHKVKYPELYQGQETGVEPRPDSELDYPIPH